jgi:hypothetical protein
MENIYVINQVGDYYKVRHLDFVYRYTRHQLYTDRRFHYDFEDIIGELDAAGSCTVRTPACKFFC